MAERATTSVADVQLTQLERLPWRRIVLVLFSIAISALVVVGTFRTLTLEGGKDTPEYWFNLVVLGIAQGAIYAMIALGYGLVYGILRMINFAHGEVFMVGAFGSYFFADAYAKSGFLESNPIAAIAIIMTVAMVCAGITAFLLERIVYRPLRNAPRLVPLISAIGASLFIQNSVRGFFGPQSKGYPKPSTLAGSWSIGGIEVPKMSVATLVVVVIAMLVLQWYVSSTKTGRSMRAVAGDREIASLMGIDVDRVIVRTFVIGGLLAGVAGVLYAMTFESVDFFMGFFPGISAFTAAVLGGIGSIGGAALGGLLLGVIESVGPFLILTGFKVPSPASLKPAFTFLVLVAVLVYRPSGLLGSGDKEKV